MVHIQPVQVKDEKTKLKFGSCHVLISAMSGPVGLRQANIHVNK